jgi:hypothetical protein
LKKYVLKKVLPLNLKKRPKSSRRRVYSILLIEYTANLVPNMWMTSKVKEAWVMREEWEAVERHLQHLWVEKVTWEET